MANKIQRLVRHNLSGGQIGKALRTRSDIEHYHKSAITQTNFLATPYGGIERRNPSIGIGNIPSIVVSSVTYTPNDARGFEFVYSIDQKYLVVLVNYVADGEDDIARFNIFDDAGTQKDYIDAPYAQEHFYEIDYHHVFDVMYFAHNSYQPRTLRRNSDTDWMLNNTELFGGPYLKQNNDTDVDISLYADNYDNSATYSIGNVVQVGSTPKSITDAKYVFWKQLPSYAGEITSVYAAFPRQFDLMRLTIASHGYSVGDVVTIENLSSADKDFSGQYEIIRAGTNTIDINTVRWGIYVRPAGSPFQWVENPDLPVSFGTSQAFLVGETSTPGFYLSTVDSNVGNPPSSSPDYWTRVYTGFEINLSSSNEVFSSGDSGRKIGFSDKFSEINTGSFVPDVGEQLSDIFPVYGVVSLETDGTWDGYLIAEITNDGERWVEVAKVNGFDGNKNHSISFDITEPSTMLRLRSEGWSSGTASGKCIYTVTSNNNIINVDITSVTDSRNAIGIVNGVIKKSLSTYLWSFGAFGGDQGYPSVVAVHEERLLFGGTTAQPYSFWGSEIDNWPNFLAGTQVTSPIIFKLRLDNVMRMCWLASRDNRLFIGTDMGEFIAENASPDSVISGVNPPVIRLVSPYGSDQQRAIVVHDKVFHVLPDRKKIRAVGEKDGTQSFISNDMTIYTPDISGDGFRQIFLQRTPYPIVWAVRDDGVLCSFTFDIENNILGWAEHKIDVGKVKSAWVIPDADSVDQVYMVINRNDPILGISGVTSPSGINGEVIGEFDIPYVTAVGGSAGNGDYFSLPDFNTEFGSFGPAWVTIGGSYAIIHVGGGSWEWYAYYGTPESQLMFTGTGGEDIPPNNWTAETGVSPAPTINDFNVEYAYETSDALIVSHNGGWGIYSKENFVLLFSKASGSVAGTYQQEAGIGDAAVTELYFLVEKLYPSYKYEDESGTYESFVELTSLIQGQGVLEKNKVRITRVMVYIIESNGGSVSIDGGVTWYDIDYSDQDYPTALFTGMREVRINSGNIEHPRLAIKCDGTKAFHLTGVAIDVSNQSERGS